MYQRQPPDNIKKGGLRYLWGVLWWLSPSGLSSETLFINGLWASIVLLGFLFLHVKARCIRADPHLLQLLSKSDPQIPEESFTVCLVTVSFGNVSSPSILCLSFPLNSETLLGIGPYLGNADPDFLMLLCWLFQTWALHCVSVWPPFWKG